MEKNRIRLDNLKKEVPYTVPDDYFEKLPQIIQSKIVSKPVGRPVIGWSWQRSLGLVSAMSLILVLIWVTVPERQGALGQEPLSDISDASILNYLEDQNISYYDLSEQRVIQNAFETDSTVLNYLDGMDENFLREQLLDISSEPVKI
jgi:hypothetical protein